MSLSVLAILEGLLLVMASFGLGFNLPAFTLGLAIMTTVMILMGFIVVARYDSINEFILPGVALAMPLALPFIDYFGLWRSWVFDLHPVQFPLELMRRALDAGAPESTFLAAMAAVIWMVVLFRWAQTAFGRFVIRSGERR